MSATLEMIHGRIVHDCPYCKGRGRVRNSILPICLDCCGTGKVCNLCGEPVRQDHECPVSQDDILREWESQSD